MFVWQKAEEMRLINKPIEVIALFRDEAPRPYRFRAEDESGELVVYHVKSILYRNKEKYDKNTMNIIIGCKGEFKGVMKDYEFKYDVMNTRWLLYRI